MDRSKLIKMLVALTAIVVIAGSLMRLMRGGSMSLAEYDRQNPPSASTASSGANPVGSASSNTNATPDSDLASSGPGASSNSGNTPTESGSADSKDPSPDTSQAQASQLTGASLNGTAQLPQRVSLTDDFYYEPLSDNLRRYITGVSYPAASSEDGENEPVVNYDDLRYVHVIHYDFDGNPAEGELICNEYIAQDLVEIFYELYYNEYQIERMLLIDEYDGDDDASMDDNNTSCFNYRLVDGSDSLSKHAYGLAIDVNPFYNPCITYEKDGTEKVSPADALDYADRSVNFPYKIDEDDLCYRLFKEHGFIWGGNWNSLKDYQHFQKAKP